MDMFHKNPAHQRGIINNITSTYQGKAEVAGRSFTVIATPIIHDGRRLGTVVEWRDRTAEIQMEREVDAMILAASQGILLSRFRWRVKRDLFIALAKA